MGEREQGGEGRGGDVSFLELSFQKHGIFPQSLIQVALLEEKLSSPGRPS